MGQSSFLNHLGRFAGFAAVWHSRKSRLRNYQRHLINVPRQFGGDAWDIYMAPPYS
jgi:hypothetical protein